MRRRLVVLALVASLGGAGSALAANSTPTAQRQVVGQRQSSLPPRGLPFTGSHLAVITSLGIALIAGGFLLRLMVHKPTLR